MALNDVDAAVESFKNALELEPNDGGQFYQIYFQPDLPDKITVTISVCEFLGGIKKELAAANRKVSATQPLHYLSRPSTAFCYCQ